MLYIYNFNKQHCFFPLFGWWKTTHSGRWLQITGKTVTVLGRSLNPTSYVSVCLPLSNTEKQVLIYLYLVPHCVLVISVVIEAFRPLNEGRKYPLTRTAWLSIIFKKKCNFNIKNIHHAMSLQWIYYYNMLCNYWSTE